MMLPLPLETVKPGFTPQGHAGLWFNRFFDPYGTEKTEPGSRETPNPWGIGKTDKHDWLKDFTKAKRGNDAALDQHAKRTIGLIQSRGGDFEIFELNWHFVTGMGYPHPVENGLSWHPTLGVPYLTGAAVKGLVRSWLEVWQGATPAQLRQWFGSESKDPEKLAATPPVAGDLVFFDAVPIAPVSLGIDVMTPHMGKWYEKGGEIQSVAESPEAVPADWHDPVPVQYLVVKNAQFLFGIAPRHQRVPTSLLAEATDALTQVLEWMGAGAKTAVGYGLMNRKDDHPLKRSALPAEERLAAEINSMADKQLAERLGKGYNKLLDELAVSPAEELLYWQVLWQLKQDTLKSWRDAPKGTAEEKAYKKLIRSVHLPQMKEK